MKQRQCVFSQQGISSNFCIQKRQNIEWVSTCQITTNMCAVKVVNLGHRHVVCFWCQRTAYPKVPNSPKLPSVVSHLPYSKRHVKQRNLQNKLQHLHSSTSLCFYISIMNLHKSNQRFPEMFINLQEPIIFHGQQETHWTHTRDLGVRILQQSPVMLQTPPGQLLAEHAVEFSWQNAVEN